MRRREVRNECLPVSGGTLGGRGLSTPTFVASLGSVAGSSPVSSISIPAAASRGSSLGGESSTGGRTGDLPLACEASLNRTSTNLVSTGNLGLLHAGGVLVLLGLRVAVEVQIGHDLPLGFAVGKGVAETQNLAGEHPPNETDSVTALVVGGDSDIDEFGRGVRVAECLHVSVVTQKIRACDSTYDDWDVDVGSLLDSLSISAGVGHNDQARFTERASDVVSEVTGGEATGNSDGTSVSGELENGTLAIGTGGDDADCALSDLRLRSHASSVHYVRRGIASQQLFFALRTIGGVVNGGDDASSEHDLLPSLANVKNIDTIGARLPQVRLHVHLQVLGAEMRLSGKQHLDVLRRRIEDGGKV